ncbi:hypothetical protein PoB_007712500 [Plakobranchus ocellatus]|uniref:Uncharacterized protein n=1 Tax=Plakobranchus ocellatus TaxID=259542 RepID=A0AAV4E2J6_9GAST|nr:hypothetical protein PoB_007712500 [Plakobranchus ocellatus]
MCCPNAGKRPLDEPLDGLRCYEYGRIRLAHDSSGGLGTRCETRLRQKAGDQAPLRQAESARPGSGETGRRCETRLRRDRQKVRDQAPVRQADGARPGSGEPGRRCETSRNKGY